MKFKIVATLGGTQKLMQRKSTQTLVTFILLGIMWQVNATEALCIANIL